MCGFAGYAGGRAAGNEEQWRSLLSSMGESLKHRGPDDQGVWFDVERGIGFAHRRLSILDVSSAGHQPMVSSTDRYVIAYNGEIYNHLDLRCELEEFTKQQSGLQWTGHSDTETLLAAIECWGIVPTLKKCVGMFAFSLWDKKRKCLTLARDRLGEKPLYYGWQQNVFLFGSELKALRIHPQFKGEIDKRSLAAQLSLGYIPSPASIYRGIKKLPPGCYVEVDGVEGWSPSNMSEPTQYWSIESVVDQANGNPFVGELPQAEDELEALLLNSVHQQMLSDVPLGAFLSGGIDSSLIASMMQAQATQPIKTFTVGFDDPAYDESEQARTIASYLGTDHTEIIVTEQQALEIVPKLATIYDEPYSDSSQIPTCLVAMIAREEVSVALSGDGGDEMFGGYSRYATAKNVWGHLERMPKFAKMLTEFGLSTMPVTLMNRAGRMVESALGKTQSRHLFGDRVRKSARLLSVQSSDELYASLIAHWTKDTGVLLEDIVWPEVNIEAVPQEPIFENRMMQRDLVSYLPDDILVKTDRASMHVGLETRVPLLSHEVVAFSARLPLQMKMDDEGGKKILKNILERYIPKEMFDRPKRGFSAPVGRWLRGPLRQWAEELISEDRLRAEGLLDPRPIRQKWHEHLSGERNWHHQLWDVLMFQAWLESVS